MPANVREAAGDYSAMPNRANRLLEKLNCPCAI